MSEKIEKKIETAKSFERQLYAENERSKKNAWRVAVAASLLSLCLGAAICVLVTIKRKRACYCGCWRKNRPYRTDYSG